MKTSDFLGCVAPAFIELGVQFTVKELCDGTGKTGVFVSPSDLKDFRRSARACQSFVRDSIVAWVDVYFVDGICPLV